MHSQSGESSDGRCASISFRGRALTAQQIGEIRALIRSHPDAPRTEVATLLARAWNLRRPNGEIRKRACQDLLLRIERQGHIRLPPPRCRPGRPRRSGVCEDGDRRPEIGPAAEPVHVDRVVVRPIVPQERPRWDEAMARFHYLGAGPIVGEVLRYVAEEDTRWLALLGWGAAVLKSRHREAYVGWNEETKYERLHLVANNVRFLILVRAPHLASAVLAKNLRRLGRDWDTEYGHPILLAETFVDLERFRGTCYRAANWIYLGETRGVKRIGEGFKEHGRKKGLFVYPVHPRAREILSAPFPSPEIVRRDQMQNVVVDVNRLPLEGQGGLIELLAEIIDPRKRQGIRHPIASVLALATMAALSGMRTYEAIAEWAKDVPKDLLRRLRCWCHQAPSEPTFRRVLQSVDAAEVDMKVTAWLAQQGVREPVAVDGKTLRGSANGTQLPCHLLSAITHDSGIVVSQEQVDEKSNEIKATKPLLEGVELEGRTVTADAMHTQKEFARFLVEEKNADYVLIAKDNQPTLKADIQLLHLESFSPSGGDIRQGARSNRNPQDLGQ